MQPNEFTDIDYKLHDDGVVVVQIQALKRKNAITLLTALELRWAARLFGQDLNAKALVITGATDPERAADRQSFSSGGYFAKDFQLDVPPHILEQIDPTDVAVKATVLEYLSLDKPIIAAVNGLAIGGGITLPLAIADQVYYSEHAWARFPFSQLGISPELGSSYLLTELLGPYKAKELLFYPCDKIYANELLELGLGNAVVPHDELLGFARRQAQKLFAPHGAEGSISAIKKLINTQMVDRISSALDRENEFLLRLTQHPDFAEGVSATAEKRAPVFTGVQH